MKCYLQCEQKLEQSKDSTSETSLHPTSFLVRVWRFFSQAMTVSTEPRIWQQRDRYGNTQYRIHNPRTGRTIHCWSEDELRIRLDQCNYD